MIWETYKRQIDYLPDRDVFFIEDRSLPECDAEVNGLRIRIQYKDRLIMPGEVPFLPEMGKGWVRAQRVVMPDSSLSDGYMNTDHKEVFKAAGAQIGRCVYVLSHRAAEAMNAKMAKDHDRMFLDGPDVVPPNTYGLKPKPYQRGSVAFFTRCEDLGFALMFDEQGLGKTASALCYVATRPWIRRVLVVAPKSLISNSNWIGESRRWLTGETENKFTRIGADGVPALIEGSIRPVESRNAGALASDKAISTQLRMSACMILTTYEAVTNNQRIFQQDWDLIVLDEMQAIGNRASQRTGAITSLQAKMRIGMSGTPGDKLEQYYSALHWFQPHVHKTMGSFMAAYQHSPKRLYAQIAPFTLRRIKEVVAKDIPPMRISIVPAGSEAEADRINAIIRQAAPGVERYELQGLTVKDAYRNLELELERIPFNKMAEIRAMMGKAKKEFAVEFIRQLADEHGKIVVGAHHKEVIAALKAAFGSEAVVLDGSMSSQQRQQAQDVFRNDPACKVFIASIKAANAGLNLQFAKHIVLIEPDWSWIVNSQFLARVHRIGQNEIVSAYFLVLPGIDHRIIQIASRKEEFINSLSKYFNIDSAQAS